MELVEVSLVEFSLTLLVQVVPVVVLGVELLVLVLVKLLVRLLVVIDEVVVKTLSSN